MKDLKKHNKFDERLNAVPKETRLYVRKSHAIADRIYELLEEKRIDQRSLSKALGKYESEISKWLSGEHNLTLQSITKLEAVLGEDIIKIPEKKVELDWHTFDINAHTKTDLFNVFLFHQLNSHNSSFKYFHSDENRVVKEPGKMEYVPNEKSFFCFYKNLLNEGTWKNKEEFKEAETV